jgi:hypothetical protein
MKPSLDPTILSFKELSIDTEDSILIALLPDEIKDMYRSTLIALDLNSVVLSKTKRRSSPICIPLLTLTMLVEFRNTERSMYTGTDINGRLALYFLRKRTFFATLCAAKAQ